MHQSLLLLSCFSRVRLCATPQTEAHQAPLSLGFSRQEHWSGCHFLLQCMKVKSESEVAQSCPTLSNPMDCSPPAPPSMGFSRQEYWSGVSLPSLALVPKPQEYWSGQPFPTLWLAQLILDQQSQSQKLVSKAHFQLFLDQKWDDLP